ncbi:hypothetical protein Q8A73_011365 [Channa argus]|nr:hypothetical protein Q8A73_011365 [Channa argus]
MMTLLRPVFHLGSQRSQMPHAGLRLCSAVMDPQVSSPASLSCPGLQRHTKRQIGSYLSALFLRVHNSSELPSPRPVRQLWFVVGSDGGADGILVEKTTAVLFWIFTSFSSTFPEEGEALNTLQRETNKKTLLCIYITSRFRKEEEEEEDEEDEEGNMSPERPTSENL